MTTRRETRTPPAVRLGPWVYAKEAGLGLMVLNDKTYLIRALKEKDRAVGLRIIHQDATYDVPLAKGVVGPCDCPDHMSRPDREGGCKHMHAIRAIMRALRQGRTHS